MGAFVGASQMMVFVLFYYIFTIERNFNCFNILLLLDALHQKLRLPKMFILHDPFKHEQIGVAIHSDVVKQVIFSVSKHQNKKI